MGLTPEELRRHDTSTLWHPFTQMADYGREGAPIIVAGEGTTLIDVDGRRYIDGVSSLWCNVHGHRVPELDRAVRDQLGRVAHSTFLGLSNVPAVLLSRELVRIAPRGLRKVFYPIRGPRPLRSPSRWRSNTGNTKENPKNPNS